MNSKIPPNNHQGDTPHEEQRDNQPLRNELEQLCEAAIEDRLSADQHARLEHLVLSCQSLRKLYIERMHLHAALAWSDFEPRNKSLPMLADIPAPLKEVSSESLRHTQIRSHRKPFIWASATVALLLVTALMIVAIRATGRHHFATLIDADRCTWQSCTMSTEVGTRLQDDDIRLSSGLAQLRFDNDVDLYLEGPCHLKIVSPSRCFLYSGQVMAKVGPAGIGFTIDTPSAEVEDFGTEFGVTVRDDLSSEVEVFQGRVDVKAGDTGSVVSMTEGDRSRFGTSPQHPTIDPTGRASDSAATYDPDSQRIVRISTALGRGRTISVQPEITGEIYPDIQHESDIYMLVKNSSAMEGCWNRKAYFTIDLHDIKQELTSEQLEQRLNDCRLQLSFGPTGVGFASRSPEMSQFSVYGLIDESLDNWSASDINWENAPANLPDAASVDPTRTMLLGQFMIPRSEPSRMQAVSGDTLREFLMSDTNGLVTFIVVRDTPETEGQGIAHGIANNLHPELPPPTLRLTLDQMNQ